MNATLEEIYEAVKVVIELFAAIIILGGGTAVITRFMGPYKKLKVDNECNAKRITELEESTTNSEKRSAAMCKALFALLDHNETGNSSGKMSRAKEALQEFIIDQ